MPVATLRELWSRRHVIFVGMVAALTAALLMSFHVSLFPPKLKSRQYDAASASAAVLVDSPTSQVVDVGGPRPESEGASTDLTGLVVRARLLAGLMASSPLKDRIATSAGIRADKLIVIAPPGDEPAPVIPATGTTVKLGDRAASVISLFVDEKLPIISVRVQAPDRGTAARLASSAVSRLADYRRTVASAGAVPAPQQLLVSPLGRTTSSTIVKGPRHLFALLVYFLLLGLWCVATVALPRLIRVWTDAARLDAAEAAAEAGTHEFRLPRR